MNAFFSSSRVVVSLSFVVLLPDHAEKLHDLPDEYLADALPIAKKIALAQGAENYNILQVRALPSLHSPPSHPRCQSTVYWLGSLTS